jgi:AraC-like DNA-binding protein
MKQHNIPVFKSATDLYISLGVREEAAAQADDCCFYNLADLCTTEDTISTSIHRAGFYSFFFVKNAYGSYLLNRHISGLLPGAVCLGNPGDIIHFSFSAVKELYLLTVSESFLKEHTHSWIMREYPFLQAEAISPLMLNQDDFADLELLYEQIRRVQFSDSPLRKRQIGYLLLLILLKIKEKSAVKIQVSQGRQTDIVRHFKQLLQQQYLDLYNGQAERPYYANEYADMMGLHPNYLNNVIRKKTGRSISKWIIDKTVQESKFLLEHSNLSIKEIAYRLGFIEASYFCRYFKRYAGMTAAEYRKNCADTTVVNNSSAIAMTV